MVDEVRNAPNLDFAALQSLSIPQLSKIYRLSKQPTPGHFLINLSGQYDMAILIIIVHIFVGVLDLVGIVGHSNSYQI